MLGFGLPPQASFAMRGDRGNGFARLFIEGELDVSAVPSFEVNLQSVEHEGRGLILDLAGVTFTDSSGIHALARAAGRALEKGRQLEIVNCPPSVERMLGLTGNQHLIRDSGVSELIGNPVGEWTPMALPQEGT
jgi:anti-sigma B factor antagonist